MRNTSYSVKALCLLLCFLLFPPAIAQATPIALLSEENFVQYFSESYALVFSIMADGETPERLTNFTLYEPAESEAHPDTFYKYSQSEGGTFYCSLVIDKETRAIRGIIGTLPVLFAEKVELSSITSSTAMFLSLFSTVYASEGNATPYVQGMKVYSALTDSVADGQAEYEDEQFGFRYIENVEARLIIIMDLSWLDT